MSMPMSGSAPSAANSPGRDVPLHNIERIFGSEEAIAGVSKEELTQGLMSIHAFVEMSRFVKGGTANLPLAFWKANNDDTARVKDTLNYLLHGGGDFIQRLHDILYEPGRKLGNFGRFCALELYGTIKPAECPPMNGRMAKTLRYLGFVNGGAKLVHPGGAKLVHLTLFGTRCWGVVPVVHRRDPRCFV